VVNGWPPDRKESLMKLYVDTSSKQVTVSRDPMVILSFRVRQGCDLRRPVVDSVADGTLAA
jgi:hypothetical protein